MKGHVLSLHAAVAIFFKLQIEKPWKLFNQTSFINEYIFYLTIFLEEEPANERSRSKSPSSSSNGTKTSGGDHKPRPLRRSLSMQHRASKVRLALTQQGRRNWGCRLTTSLAPRPVWPQAYFGSRHISARGIIWPNTYFGLEILRPETTSVQYPSAIEQSCHYVPSIGLGGASGWN